MAHECMYCGSECYCHNDIDDVVTMMTPKNCKSCGCEDERDEYMDEEYSDEEE